MSIVKDRRCDGCGELRDYCDEEWFALIPPGWNGVDDRLDFCEPKCLEKFVRSTAFKNWRAEQERV